jgi:hypothetical protein
MAESQNYWYEWVIRGQEVCGPWDQADEMVKNVVQPGSVEGDVAQCILNLLNIFSTALTTTYHGVASSIYHFE